MAPDHGASDDHGANEPEGTVSWRQLHREAIERFEAAGVEEAEVSARRIVEECAGFEPAEFALGLDQLATERGVAAFDSRVERRLGGEPLQYVIGRWGFRELDLFIDRRVLIPRPETEIVAGLALDELERQRGAASPLTVVDLGTGSGAVGLSIALESERGPAKAGSGGRKTVGEVEVWLTDASPDALAVARANLAGLGAVGGRVRVEQGSWFEAVPPELAGTLAVVVSNPPYIGEDETLPRSVVDWEPSSALIAADDGLADLRHIVAEAPAWLRSDGALVLEMAPHQTDLIAAVAAERFHEVDIERDMSGMPRALVARRRI